MSTALEKPQPTLIPVNGWGVDADEVNLIVAEFAKGMTCYGGFTIVVGACKDDDDPKVYDAYVLGESKNLFPYILGFVRGFRSGERSAEEAKR